MAFPEERKAEWDVRVRRRAVEREREKAEDEEREREAKEADAEACVGLYGLPRKNTDAVHEKRDDSLDYSEYQDDPPDTAAEDDADRPADVDSDVAASSPAEEASLQFVDRPEYELNGSAADDDSDRSEGKDDEVAENAMKMTTSTTTMVEMNACSAPDGITDEAEMVEEPFTEKAAEKNASVKTPKKRYCEICKIVYGTPWNFKRHAEEKHTANNTVQITAKREKQNERRNTCRKERYANDPKYKEKIKQLSTTGRLKKRARVEIEEETILNSDPDSEDKVNGNEEDTVSPREGREVTESADENKAKKTDTQGRSFQLKTEPLSKKGLEFFFQPRSSAPRSCVISREAVAV